MSQWFISLAWLAGDDLRGVEDDRSSSLSPVVADVA